MFNFKDYNIDLFNVINNFPVNIYMKDKTGRFIWCNANQLKSLGLNNIDQYTNKTEHDFRDKQIADMICKNDVDVIKSGNTITIEEICVEKGKEIFYISKKSPLLNKKGNVVGVMGISLDLTNQVSLFNQVIQSKEQKERSLEDILSVIPAHIYWKDKDGAYLGCNDLQAKNIGLKNRNEIIGKTDFDISVSAEAAQKFRDNDLSVIKSGKNVIVEETVVINQKQTPVLSYKVPLKNSDGYIIGMAGISLDISSEKEAEQLKAQIEKHEALESKNRLFKDFTEQLTSLINTFQVLNDRGESALSVIDTDNIKLTKRETEVLYFLSRGKKPKEIAVKLNISPKTVQNIVDGHLFPKFETHNIGDLIDKARMLNLIPFTL